MLKENIAVLIEKNSIQVQEAVHELDGSGFDLNKISIIGHAFGIQSELTAYYSHGGILKCWGTHKEFWNGLSDSIRRWVLFSCPGTGSLLAIGSVAQWIVAVLDNSAIFGSLSVLGATLYSMGLAKDRVQEYEEALRKGNYLLIIHGPAEDVMRAKKVLKSMVRVRAEEKQ